MSISDRLEFTEGSDIARCTLCGGHVLPDGNGHDCPVVEVIREIVREEIARALPKGRGAQ